MLTVYSTNPQSTDKHHECLQTGDPRHLLRRVFFQLVGLVICLEHADACEMRFLLEDKFM
jgi:hypothetical protein